MWCRVLLTYSNAAWKTTAHFQPKQTEDEGQPETGCIHDEVKDE